MNFDIGAVFTQIISAYARLPLAQKIAIPVLFAGSLGVIVFVSRWATRPDYGLLFSNLESNDAASITEKLKADKIGFRLRDEGRTIEITPADRVYQVRLDLAGAGLPQGGSNGFELFNESPLGRTGFVEKIMLIRALQGELERSIQSISSVRSVRVHITSPEKSHFVKRDVLPTASVLLNVKAGGELTAPQVRGIAHLVANSVERLTPENVTIIDSHGNVLNEKRRGDDGSMDSTQVAYKQSVEDEYSRRIETMLGEILGPGRAVARVTLDLDFSKYEKEEEAFDPAAQVIRSERSVVEAGGLTAEGGIPGVVSNLSNDTELLTPPDSNKNSNRHSETVKNYEVSRAVSKTVSAPGALRKLSAAVLVDGQYEIIPGDATKGEPGTKQYKPLSAEMLRKIENLVKQAVGYDGSRGDNVSIENIRFLEPEESVGEALKQADSQNFLFRVVEGWVFPAFFWLLFLLFIVRPLVKFLVNPTDAEVDLSRLLPEGIQDLEAELEAERSKLSTRAEDQAPEVNIEELEELIAENSRIVKENPQQAALLIRYWLNEGKA